MDTQPRHVRLAHEISMQVWGDWETMPTCCRSCTAEWVRAIAEPILRDDLEGDK